MLSLLPADSALVSIAPHPGVPFIQMVPPLSSWGLAGGSLIWNSTEPPGWTYAVKRLDEAAASSASNAAPTVVVRQVQGGSEDKVALAITTTTSEDLPNGSFQDGLWGPVGDCANSRDITSSDRLNAEVLTVGGPSGAGYLRLTAKAHSACEVQPVTWKGGSVLVRLSARHVSGASPRFCLWRLDLIAVRPFPQFPPAWEDGTLSRSHNT